jgi:tetraprenyl-beta-curcumene synthase
MTGSDPAPVTGRQLRTLLTSATRELGWGLWAVKDEVARWRARAEEIRDPSLRREARAAIDDKRPLLDGAALFWTLPNHRRLGLLRLLVRFQILANFHDNASERAARGEGRGPASSVHPLVQVLDTSALPARYYGETMGARDGGYLWGLADACRAECLALPHYDQVRPLLLREVHRARSLDLEHDLDPQRRIASLRTFAHEEFGPVQDTAWWELTAGTGSLMTVLAVLALAADEGVSDQELHRAVDAYTWVGSVSALLDNYVDQVDDARTGAHNYLNYYASPETGVERLGMLVVRASRAVAALRNGERHLVIVASMTALFLTSTGAQSSTLRGCSKDLTAAAGSLTRLLIPVLTAWRWVYRQPAG